MLRNGVQQTKHSQKFCGLLDTRQEFRIRQLSSKNRWNQPSRESALGPKGFGLPVGNAMCLFYDLAPHTYEQIMTPTIKKWLNRSTRATTPTMAKLTIGQHSVGTNVLQKSTLIPVTFSTLAVGLGRPFQDLPPLVPLARSYLFMFLNISTHQSWIAQ